MGPRLHSYECGKDLSALITSFLEMSWRCDTAEFSASFDENHYFVISCKKVIGSRQQESVSSGNLYPICGCPPST